MPPIGYLLVTKGERWALVLTTGELFLTDYSWEVNTEYRIAFTSSPVTNNPQKNANLCNSFLPDSVRKISSELSNTNS